MIEPTVEASGRRGTRGTLDGEDEPPRTIADLNVGDDCDVAVGARSRLFVESVDIVAGRDCCSCFNRMKSGFTVDISS